MKKKRKAKKPTRPWPWIAIILLYPVLVAATVRQIFNGYHYEYARVEKEALEARNSELTAEAAGLNAIRAIPTKGLVPTTNKNITFYKPSRTGIPPSR